MTTRDRLIFDELNLFDVEAVSREVDMAPLGLDKIDRSSSLNSCNLSIPCEDEYCAGKAEMRIETIHRGSLFKQQSGSRLAIYFQCHGCGWRSDKGDCSYLLGSRVAERLFYLRQHALMNLDRNKS